MIEIPNDFIKNLVISENPLDDVWNYLCSDIWIYEEDIPKYFSKNENHTANFERFFKNAYFEIYDFIIEKSLKNRDLIKNILNQSRYFLIIADGFSLREANLFLKSAESKGYGIENYTYEISHLPSETIIFTKDVLEVSAPSQLKVGTPPYAFIYLDNENADYPIPYADRILAWLTFPDSDFNKIPQRNIGDSLAKLYLKVSKILLKLIENADHDEIIITSDHGYGIKLASCNWSAPEKEIFQEVFGSARFKLERDIFGDMEEKTKELIEKTDRLKKVGDYVVVNSRYIWPVRGSKKQIYHGGISFMENFVPFIRIRT